jgi:TRAP-type mannitol/chloroaromatic compound transport system permease small subunit
VGLSDDAPLPDSSSWIGRLISTIGKSVAWLTLAMICLTFVVVVMRYGFNQGWVWMQESVTYMHAMVFMLAAAWALQTDDHVRVDIFYRDSSPKRKAWVNLLGTLLFLAPVCVFLILISWNYVSNSWAVMETSREAGGLPLVYIQKSLILLLPALLLLQSVETVKASIRTLFPNPK